MSELKYDKYEKHITAKYKFFSFPLKELIQYRDLILLYTRKNVVVTYKQTILGPVWLWMTPLLSSLLQMFVFGYLAGFQTGNVPKIVFYLFSNTAWTLHSGVVTNDSQIFVRNQRLFSKVRFPRIAISYSNMLSTVITTGFQFILAFLFLFYYMARGEVRMSPAFLLAVFPLALLLLFGQGIGLLFASLTIRYRDMNKVQPLLTRILMYISPVVYPLAQLGSGKAAEFFLLNPLTAPMELFRYFLWGAPLPPLWSIAYSTVFALLINIFGILIFNKKERTFVDAI